VNTELLVVKHLKKCFGKIEVLHGIDFSVTVGEVYGVAGQASQVDLCPVLPGMTVKEIAQADGVDLSWVYKSIKRGLIHLAKSLSERNS